MNARQKYFECLITDAVNGLADVHSDISPQEIELYAPAIISAMIISDSINGLRKAVLELAEATRQAQG